MTSRGLSVFVLIMVVLSGCAGMIPGSNMTNSTDTMSTSDGTTHPDAQPTAPPSTARTGADTTSRSSPSSSTTTAASAPPSTSSPPVSGSPDRPPHDTTSGSGSNGTPSQANPWGERTLTVAIKDKTGKSRQFAPLVRDALAYWEQNSKQYAGYPINYKLKPNAANPDIVVSFVSSINKCGVERRVEGCAPYIRSSNDVNRPVDVQIRSGYTDDSTVQLLIHEFGHTLGLDHQDEPEEIMAAETDLTTLPKPNVTERALPWDHSKLSVAVDLSSVPASKRSAVNTQIDEALTYYDRGADGTVPKRVSFRRVSNPKKADIVIQFSKDSPCPGLSSGSCSVASGYDPDDDGATETYAKTKIVLTNVDTDTVAWHVGNRLGEDAFGFDEQSDFPPPLRSSTSTETRSSRWWE